MRTPIFLVLWSLVTTACGGESNPGTGATAPPGASNSGGAGNGGATTGGAKSTGGVSNTGGTPMGGASNAGGGSTGGASNTGGASIGGASNTGGVPTGGTAGSGGTSGTGGSQGCAQQYNCAPGESCGTLDGTTFACHVSGTGKMGDACNQNQGLPLQCADHLICLGLNGTGSCRQWCSPNDPCPAGSGSCTTLQTTHGVTLSLCL